MKTKNILFAAGLLFTAFQASAQLTSVIGQSKIPLKVNIIKVSPFCHGESNGKILIKIGGGAQVALVDPADLQVSSIVNNVSTFHGSDGSIILNVNEPNPTFIWQKLTPGPNNNLVITNKNQTGLSAGFYGVTITNGKGCSTYRKYEITQPNTPVIGVSSNPGVVGGDDSSVSSNISVYPNPSSGHVTLSAREKIHTAYIMNDLGIVIQTLDFKNESQLAGLDLNPGVYTLVSIDELGNRATERIVIR
jgi:hypothetical protein